MLRTLGLGVRRSERPLKGAREGVERGDSEPPKMKKKKNTKFVRAAFVVFADF